MYKKILKHNQKLGHSHHSPRITLTVTGLTTPSAIPCIPRILIRVVLLVYVDADTLVPKIEKDHLLPIS